MSAENTKEGEKGMWPVIGSEPLHSESTVILLVSKAETTEEREERICTRPRAPNNNGAHGVGENDLIGLTVGLAQSYDAKYWSCESCRQKRERERCVPPSDWGSFTLNHRRRHGYQGGQTSSDHAGRGDRRGEKGMCPVIRSEPLHSESRESSWLARSRRRNRDRAVFIPNLGRPTISVFIAHGRRQGPYRLTVC